MKKIKIFLTILCISSILVQCEYNEFETNEPLNYSTLMKSGDFQGVLKNLVRDYGANGTDQKNDSNQLQTAIDEVTNLADGGTIFIPFGRYYFGEINLKSNVHIVIERNTIIYPIERKNNKNYSVFYVGNNKLETIKNVSVRSIKGRFVVNLREVENSNVRVFQLINVENFMISDFNVLDKETKFSAISFGLGKTNGVYFTNKNGSINNISSFSSAYGFGLVQVQVADNVSFNNLYSEGGVTLRLESGEKKLNQIQPEGLGIFNIKANNIGSKNGNAAVMLSPHTIKNGRVAIENVKSMNSGFAVRVDKGFTNKEQEAAGLVPGFFESSTIKNVAVGYGSSSAQLKWKHWSKYMDCELRTYLTPNPDDITGQIGKVIFSGASIAPILYDAQGEGPGYYDVTITNVRSKGFRSINKKIVTEEDYIDCNSQYIY